jgi:prepilin-type processing-associated H-X9-DG protein
MDEHLVGYLFNLLDPHTHSEVETYLRDHPDARARLDALRRSVEPLEADRDEIEPPAGLWVRTLARVAEHSCRELPRAPVLPMRAPSPAPRRRWTRPDALVAAGILLCIGLLIPPGIGHLRYRHERAICQNNLRPISVALDMYADLDHPPGDPEHVKGSYPNVARKGNRNIAGAFLPALVEAGVMRPEQLSVSCPGLGSVQIASWTPEQLRRLSDEEFNRVARDMAASYGYTLGYRNELGHILGLRRGDQVRPIVADRPPDGGHVLNGQINSPNHQGRGQNVLYTDGHVDFHPVRRLAGDDIFLNEANEPAAGLHWRDNVLGASGTRPAPRPIAPGQD